MSPLLTRRLRTGAFAGLAWTLLAFTYAAAMVGSARVRGQEMTWASALGYNAANCYLWMLLSPAAIAAAKWAGFEARQWPRALAVHVPTYLVLALIQHWAFLSAYWRWGSPAFTLGTPLAVVLRNALPWRLHDGLVVYGLLLGSLYALHHLRKGEVEREARLEAEARLAEAQLQALRMQLQPHFLFNTLNAISALVLADPPRAKAMLAKLGGFLRLTLEDAATADVPLSQELRFLEAYLDIQRMRFEDRLEVALDLAEDVLALTVPHLVLQPLVENALQHGVARRPGPARLAVLGRRERDRLVLAVEDDGAGLASGWAEGIGLANTRARVKARYGDSAELTLEGREGGGARATLNLPLGVPA